MTRKKKKTGKPNSLETKPSKKRDVRKNIKKKMGIKKQQPRPSIIGRKQTIHHPKKNLIIGM